MIEIFLLYLSIPSRINFLQLGRYSLLGEQRFRCQFEQRFDFFSFNKALSMPWIGKRCCTSIRVSFLNRASIPLESDTFGRHFVELKFLAFSNRCRHKAKFPSGSNTDSFTNCLQDNELSLIDWYAAVIKKLIKLILSITRYVVADAYFS